MDRRYVGIDLHRRRSVINATDAEGDKLFCERIDNDALLLLEVVSEAGDGAAVVVEAATAEGFELVEPPVGGQWCWGFVRVNDVRDAAFLEQRQAISYMADWLRRGRAFA